jgi:hypothetical protein
MLIGAFILSTFVHAASPSDNEGKRMKDVGGFYAKMPKNELIDNLHKGMELSRFLEILWGYGNPMCTFTSINYRQDTVRTNESLVIESYRMEFLAYKVDSSKYLFVLLESKAEKIDSPFFLKDFRIVSFPINENNYYNKAQEFKFIGRK